MIKIIEKFFCKHKWKTHHTREYNWTEKEIIKGTEDWHAPHLATNKVSEVVEILICKKCGKVHKIVY